MYLREISPHMLHTNLYVELSFNCCCSQAQGTGYKASTQSELNAIIMWFGIWDVILAHICDMVVSKWVMSNVIVVHVHMGDYVSNPLCVSNPQIAPVKFPEIPGEIAPVKFQENC